MHDAWRMTLLCFAEVSTKFWIRGLTRVANSGVASVRGLGKLLNTELTIAIS